MTRREYKGGAPQLTLSGNINASGVTTINTVGTVTNWPTGGTGKFLIVIDKGNAGEEKIFCNGRTGNALSVASDADRGADNTSAASHVSGVTINHVGGAIDLDEPNAHINVTANDDHTQYLNAARHDITARHVFGSAYGTPGTPASTGVASSTGSAGGPPHSDHVHGAYNHNAGRAIVTSSQSLGTSVADITGLTTAFTAVTGRLYKVTLWLPLSINQNTAATISLQEGATVLAFWGGSNTSTSSAFGDVAEIIYTNTFSAGSHTLKGTGIYFSGGAGAGLTASGASNNPALILVEDIGT